jgi:hypothetical protein
VQPKARHVREILVNALADGPLEAVIERRHGFRAPVEGEQVFRLAPQAKERLGMVGAESGALRATGMGCLYSSMRGSRP